MIERPGHDGGRAVSGDIPPPPVTPPAAPPGAPDPIPAGTAPVVPAAGGDRSLGVRLRAGAVPADAGSAWMWVLYAAIGFIGGQVVALVLVFVVAGVVGQEASLSRIVKLAEPPTWYLVSTLVGLWSGFFVAAWLSSRFRGTRHLAEDVGLRFRWIDLVGIPIGFGGQFLVALMYLPIKTHVHDFNQRFNAPSQRLIGGSHGAGYVLIAVCTIAFAPFFEELFFRGVLLRAVGRLALPLRAFGTVLAVLVTGVLFGLAHAESLQLLGLATFGVLLSAISWRTGRLGMNMVAHASFNFLAVVAVVPALGAGHL